MSAASGKRIAEVLEEKADITDPSKPLDRVKDGSIDFDHVTFSYRKKGEPNIRDLSFRIRRGETLGIIGEIGSGKTTIINLLLRLYDTDQGRILIGGRDVREIPTREFKDMFGVAFQNDTLFN